MKITITITTSSEQTIYVGLFASTSDAVIDALSKTNLPAKIKAEAIHSRIDVRPLNYEV